MRKVAEAVIEGTLTTTTGTEKADQADTPEEKPE
jgi:hypothetical protein